jgi:electron transport complex, RnfABCDGE type, D subunit
MPETKKLIVSFSPHIGSRLTTRKIMAHMIVALSFTLVAGVVLYGLYAFVVVAVAVAAAVLAEILSCLMLKKPMTVGDLSAVVSGMILGLILPPYVPLYVPAVGSFFAIIVVKMLFGGLGKNFANPAATARVFLLFSWAGLMTKYSSPVDYSLGAKAFLTGFTNSAVTSATPLAGIKAGAATGIYGGTGLLDLFLGNTGGSIGEVSAVAISAALIYLLIFKIIDWKAPAAYVGFSALFALIFYKSFAFVLPTILSGGLLFAGVFMLTDYATSPITRWGVIIFSGGAALMTLLIRRYGGYPEGASIAILFMNLLVPFIDKFTYPKPYGYVKKKREARRAKN